jgi:hypothetical protein
MSDAQKIHMDEVHVSVRPEEIDSILGLRNTFDYFEILGKYVSSYLELGWIVKLVIPHLDIALDIDFRQVREVWNQGLTDLAVKGIHACLMVYTGSASNLLVLGVRGKNSEKALVFGRDWRARCIMQAGEEKELHFFTWPQTLTLPDQTAFETLDLQIFGEGGKVALPPSLAPAAGEPVHWLVPPWENPPCPPTPRLMEFLRGHCEGADLGNQQAESEMPAWEEIFTHIASHASLMQTLLTPVASSEEYYRGLLKEARAVGLEGERLLLGLLWHAPLGSARHEPKSLQGLKDLLQETNKGSGLTPNISQVEKQLADLIQDLSMAVADLNKAREHNLQDTYKNPDSLASQPNHAGQEMKSWLTVPKNFTLGHVQESSFRSRSQSSATTERPSRYVVHPPIYPHGEIPVNRNQYEAMIYELGRLGAVEKINHRFVKEADSTKVKIEAQRQEEIDHLRQLVREKKNRKWW